MGTRATPVGEARDERQARRAAARRTRRTTRWGDLRVLTGSSAGRALVGLVTAVALLTVAGLVLLWPAERADRPAVTALGGATLPAEVVAASTSDCGGPVRQACRVVTAHIGEGADRGRAVTLALGPVRVAPTVGPGDAIRVQRSAGGYGYADVDRRQPLWALALVFAGLAVVVTRVRGVLALAGLVLSLALVGWFVLPAILAGSSPVLVSLVGSLAVMFVTVGLTYGIGAQSLAAALGIGVSLLAAAGLGALVVAATQLDGRTGELQPLLALGTAGEVSLAGVVLAGLVIGVLGVVTDMAVSQASAVVALRQADPGLRARELYRAAFAVGRDHLSATVHTLVLAYVGASLPLLLVLSEAQVALGDALNGQLVAEPLVATLVGAVVLVLSVPLTTGLAAHLAARVPVEALGAAHGGHAH